MRPLPTATRRVVRVAFAIAAVGVLLVVAATAGSATAAAEKSFAVAADSYIAADFPTRSFGDAKQLKLDQKREGVPRYGLVRFAVTGLDGDVTRATLRLYTLSANDVGFSVHQVADNSWDENNVTWENAPAIDPAAVASSGPHAASSWQSLDVSSLVRANGTFSFALESKSLSNLFAASREAGASTAAQLVVETNPATPPPPPPPTVDTTAPSMPTALTKTGSTDTQVSLSWTGSTDNVGVTGYEVYRDGVLAGTTTQTSHSVTGLSCGQTYTFAVDAVDAAGNRSPKTSLSASTNACPAPAPALDTTAPTMPATLTKTGSTETQVSLSWSSSSDNVGVTGYGVYRDGALVGSTTTQTTYTAGGLTCGKTYGFAVDAVDAAGNRSAKKLLDASTNACPPAPAPAPGSNLAFPIRAAFYYPWFPETWSVNGVHVKYNPGLGYYSSDDAAAAQSHVRQLQYGGFQAAIASWWGPGTHNESTRLPLLMNTTTSLGASLKWTLYYEAEGNSNPTVAQIQSDLSYLSKYTSHSAFARVNGKPVIFVYNANDTTCEVADRWKQASAGNWYVVLKVFSGYANCANQPDSWHQYGPATAESVHLPHSFNISPGFWRADEATPRLARDPLRWAQNVKNMIASGANWQLVTSFNEWGEGTAVENAVDWISTSGYGTYLDTLHNNGGTAPAPPPPSTDTSAPTAPTGLAATGATTSSLSLSWNASSDNVGVAGYGVYRDGVLDGTTAQRTYTMSGLACGKSYVITVDAYDAAGNRSGKSSALTLATSACPVSDTTAPTAPGSLRTTGATTSSVALAWNASTDNVGVTGYNLYRDGAFVTTTTALSYNVTGLTCGTSYTFGAEALDAAGNKSTRSTLTAATSTCPTPPPSSGDPIVAIAGDIAGDGTGDTATAAVLDSMSPTAVLTAGDNAYNDGSLTQYQSYYDPTWGRYKPSTYPTPGNHEYQTSGASGYFSYFGARAGPSGKGFYSYNLGAWHLIALNSEIAHDAGSEQVTWLKSDLAASGARCVMAYWHKPRFTAGNYSDMSEYQPFWDALYAANADVVVNGHDHNYQRYAPMTPAGARDTARGIREFVVGTGGRSHYGLRADSRREAADDTAYGVLKLTLRSTGYDWQFLPEAGRTFSDSGSTDCH